MPTPGPSRKRKQAMIAALMTALFAIFAVCCAGLTPAHAAPTHIATELVAESAAQPGQTATMAIVMRPEAGWHGYWSNPGDAGLGMVVDWSLPTGAKAGPLRYPVPDTLLIAGLMNHVFEHEYALLVDVQIPAGAKPGAKIPVSGQAQWLACTDKICVPESGEIAATVTVGPPGNPEPRFAAWRAALPAPLGSPASYAFAGNVLRIGIPLPAAVGLDDPHLFVSSERAVDYAAAQAFSRRGDMLVIELPRARFEPLDPGTLNAVLRLNRGGDGLEIAATTGNVPPAGTPLQTPARPQQGMGWLLLSALLGGLLLNIMPCVFPILSLKALSLARAGESDLQARAEGLAYTAGVVLACVALGVLLLALRAAGEQVGWAFQLQEPVVVAALLLLAVAITANLLGLFEFAVPGFAREGSPQGAFATGLLAAFVATPCTGPFMAAAMGAALLLPPLSALVLFAALGLGLALPFLALAFVPALRRRLPKPGAWMNRFKLAMAVPMGLTALALLWLESRVAGSRFALLSLVFAAAVVAALFLIGLRQRSGRSGRAPALFAVAAAVIAILVLPATASAPGKAAPGLLPSAPFSEAALSAAKAQGKPIFAYFTADWCLTCKVNEAAAIEREETRAAFAKAGVVVLRGDWTRRDPAITRYLTQQGAAGVPLYMWYPAGGGQPRQLPQVLTSATLSELVR
ncbi:thioredoxin family protein [Novosphingobium sp.]|uniref:protein-disulfide reductase DsbD family protein n=1 Tax=Novosphingobium sp. TaxID=1874826 RepID=UPI0025E88D67|nr:thioredoxin family protein [Novosphingobium sp.]